MTSKIGVFGSPAQGALNIDELAIEKGEKVFPYGPSGSGKTTLLGIVFAVLKADRGSIQILEDDLARMSGPARDALRGAHIGYIFQMFNLIPYLNVLENIVLPCRVNRGTGPAPEWPAGGRSGEGYGGAVGDRCDYF